jgi:hypothetical protein
VAQSALVDVVRGGRDVSHGVTARELLELSGNLGLISASTLEHWLVTNGFAELIDEHELVPTALALEIAGDLRFLDG